MRRIGPVTAILTVLVGASVGTALLAQPSGQLTHAQSMMQTSPGPRTNPTLTPGSPPDYLLKQSDLSGHVIHTSERSYYNHGPNDTINGVQDSSAEIWVRLDTTDNPDLVHAIIRNSNGTVIGEQLLGPTGGTWLRVPGTVPGQPAAATCKSDMTYNTTSGLSAFVPQFVNTSLLASEFGLSKSAPRSPSQRIPATTASGLTPLKTYDSDSTITPWVSQGKSRTGQSSYMVVETDTNGRMVYRDGRVTDANGAILQEFSLTYGPVEVYDTSAVPATAFTLTTGVCDGR